MEVILKLWVYDRPGVLDRIAGLIRRKGWNIDSLTAGDIEQGVSQINMSLTGQAVEARVLCEHLEELDFLRSWEECTPETHVIWEMLLFSVPREHQSVARQEGMRIIREVNGIIFAEFTGTPEQVSDLLQTQKDCMMSCSRSGPLVLANNPVEDSGYEK